MEQESMKYSEVGVDTTKAESALTGLRHWLDKTLPLRNDRVGIPLIGIGYFASIVQLNSSQGLAISTDGVGTKIIVARMMDKYDTVGIDCIAMNVNDVLCVGAEPITVVDYLAVKDSDPTFVTQIAKGLHDGAQIAQVSIPGGELAQLPELLDDDLPGIAFDLAGTAIGTVPLDRIISGDNITDGNVIVGFQSSGIHSNGLTLARKVLFDKGKLNIDTFSTELGRTVGEELLEPTTIYVPLVMAILDSGIQVKGMAHITGDGLLNLTRVESKVGFIIDDLPEPQSIFSMIQHYGNIDDAEMFQVFNMGIGFCIIINEYDAGTVIRMADKYDITANVIGHVVADEEKRIQLPTKGLTSKGNKFVQTIT
ncbi:MAG: phosphoribosylformylglycinamidine cyclo-ligase [Chloroflexota bacterium]|nr:phosphoribosylformylglycinamidine cyclo-ligase [Chloroflexota bacterium]